MFDPSRDNILLTVSLPQWARADQRVEWLGQLFCWLLVAIRIVSDPEKVTVSYFVTDDVSLYAKGRKVLCVYLEGLRELPQPQGLEEDPFGLRDLGKEASGESPGNDPPQPQK